MKSFCLYLLAFNLFMGFAHAQQKLTKEQFNKLKMLNGFYRADPTYDCNLKNNHNVELELWYEKDSEVFSFVISYDGITWGGHWRTMLETYAPRNSTDPKKIREAHVNWTGEHSLMASSTEYNLRFSKLNMNWTIGADKKVKSVEIDLDWAYRPNRQPDEADYSDAEKCHCVLKPKDTFLPWGQNGDPYPRYDD